VSTQAEDPRLRELAELIGSGRFDLLSLDVFDTIVWRKVPLPHDVHFIVADRLARLGNLYPTSSAESYVRERMQAEERARRRSPSLEVTLDEIYREFPPGYLRELPVSRMPGIEFEVERELVRPREDLIDLARRARASGLRIALVSDTYFGADQIAALSGVEADFVVVSCEHRLSKYQGLHKVLTRQSGVPPQRILHVGDNRQADVVGPAPFGIECFWFRQVPEPFDEIMAQELPATLSARAAYLTSDDRGLTYARRRAVGSCSDAYGQWGAGVLGPVVAGFGEWVARRCAEEHLEGALCLMREGRILKTAIDACGLSIPTAEVFISRYVARKAAIFEGTVEELRDFVFRPTPKERSRILTQLGFNGDHPWRKVPDSVLGPAESLELIGRICGDPRLRRLVVRSSAEFRGRLLAHLRAQSDLLDAGRVGIVDLGYRGTIQACLERIFRGEGLAARTHGLYLVTSGDVGSTQATGAPVEGWLAANGQPVSMAQTFVRSPEIFEQCLMAECGTTVGYEADGTPVLDALRIPAPQAEQIASVQRGVEAFLRVWEEHRRGPTEGSGAQARRFYQAICVRAVAKPVEAEIEMFGSWVHDENFGSENARRLTEVAGMDPWEATHISAHQIASLPVGRVYWPFGFAREMDPATAKAVAGIYLRTIEPEAFDAPDSRRCLVLYQDSGQGFSAKDAKVVPYTLNARGNIWMRLPLEGSDAGGDAVGFTIGVPGEVLRLAGVSLRRRDEQGEARVRRIPHDAIEMHGYERLHANLYLVREDPALMVVRDADLKNRNGHTDIDLFFGVIPAE
jgi:FMN phosphatase YigB (HAD superfamily)